MKGSLSSSSIMNSFENHINPEKEEQLRRAKIEVESKVKRILKLAKGIHGSKEGNMKKEIVHLVEDFHQHYDSLYSLYEDIRGEAKNLVDSRDDGSSNPSDSEEYYSPVGSMYNHSRESSSEAINMLGHNDDETSDVEDTILKDKLTSSSEVKETDPSHHIDSFFKDLRVQDEEIRPVRVTDLEEEVARLRKEVEGLSLEKHKLKEKLVSETKERSIEVKGLVEQVECLHLQKAELELEHLARKENEHAKGGSKGKVSLGSHQAMVEKQELLRKMSQIQTSLLISERKLTAQEKKFKQSEDGLSAQIKSLNQKAKLQENRMVSLHKEKNSLLMEMKALKNEKQQHLLALEKEKQESLILKSKMERKNNELTNKIADQQKTLLELGDFINKLKVENIKSHPNFQVMEAKIEEIAQEFRNQFEDKYRAMSRRIRAAEKLQIECKEWYLNANEAYEQEFKAEQGRIDVGLRNIKDMSLTANDMLISLDSVGLKLEECNANFLNRISKTSCEVKYAKDWVRRKNKAILQVKYDLDDLLCQLDDKEGEITELRERVWKLENKLREAETRMKEKDDGVKEMREEKREAIRQLCVWIDYHRCRTDYYKKVMKRMPEMNARRRTAVY